MAPKFSPEERASKNFRRDGYRAFLLAVVLPLLVVAALSLYAAYSR